MAKLSTEGTSPSMRPSLAVEVAAAVVMVEAAVRVVDTEAAARVVDMEVTVRVVDMAEAAVRAEDMVAVATVGTEMEDTAAVLVTLGAVVDLMVVATGGTRSICLGSVFDLRVLSPLDAVLGVGQFSARS